MSAWDMITRAMLSPDNNFSKDNVFINFQLTKRRGDICKEVRQAKKDNIIKSYEIDTNGRIFVKYVGENTQRFELFSKGDVQRLSPKAS